jgi:hypothetical protein
MRAIIIIYIFALITAASAASEATCQDDPVVLRLKSAAERHHTHLLCKSYYKGNSRIPTWLRDLNPSRQAVRSACSCLSLLTPTTTAARPDATDATCQNDQVLLRLKSPDERHHSNELCKSFDRGKTRIPTWLQDLNPSVPAISSACSCFTAPASTITS